MRVEHWWFTLPLRLKSILRRGRVERELDEELQFHLENKIEEGIAGGHSPREARLAALRAMGGVEQRKEEMRDMRRIHWLTDFVDDIHYAIRSLRRVSKLTAFVVITLALGIGMTAASFSMVDALIFRPYPVPPPNRVLTSAPPGPVGFSPDPKATPRVKGGMLVSGNFFRVLGVEPRIGRGFREDEDRVPGRDPVVVLGSDFWKHELAGDRSVVGRTIRLNGTDFTIIGVAPESFPGMQIFYRPDFFIPLAMARLFSTSAQKNFFEDRDARELTVRARLKPGTTLQQARSELSVLARDFERAYPQLNRNRGAAIYTQFEYRTQGDSQEWKFSVIFVILALGVLLVACTNVAGVLLARAQTRTREIAVRLALGAGRSRLIRMLLTESLILACLGGLGGIAVAYGVISFFGKFRIPTELPLTIPFRMDTRVLLACLVMSGVSALLCGLAPALQSSRADRSEEHPPELQSR